MAKAIGGGLPLGAILTDDELAGVYGKAGHGTTFGGNPIACAAGVACIDTILREQLVTNVAWIGSELISGLEELQATYPALIRDVRGAGCMIGMELHVPADAYSIACRERGLLVNVTQGSVVRLLPPYVLQAAHVDEALAVMRAAMEILAASLPSSHPPAEGSAPEHTES
jgi:acetylornithine/succinyldiaminopimelate/putrescine aminotransferase